MFIANNIRYYRRLEGLSVAEFAKRLNVSESTVRCYENGKTVPSVTVVARISHILNVTTDKLLGIQ